MSPRAPRRWLAGLALACSLSMGPAPGAVGSCGGDDLAEPADFTDYCEKREQLACVRRFLRREITEFERDTCRWDALDLCARRSFPPGCHPTRREAQTCLNALASLDTLQTKESELRECQSDVLCDLPRAPESEADAGASDAGESP